jgi:DNA invertase Pin-like site-specific DNA recombinase
MRLAPAVSYLRVSTVEQARRNHEPEGFSIPAQREACARKAELLEAEIVREFVDRGESARSADRPQLQAMLAYIAEHDVRYVIVHKIDRLARNLADHVEITLAIRKAGAELVSVTENVDDTPLGEYMRTIFAANAQLYSANLAAEARKGLHQKAKRGGTPGLAPIGYVNVRKVVDGYEVREVEIDHDRAPLVQRAFAAYASGAYTLDTLHAALKRWGLTTRPTRKKPAKPLSRSALATMLAQQVLHRHRHLRRGRVRGRPARAADRQGHLLPRPAGPRRPQPRRREGPQAPSLSQGHALLRPLRLAPDLHARSRQRRHLLVLRLRRARHQDGMLTALPAGRCRRGAGRLLLAPCAAEP